MKLQNLKLAEFLPYRLSVLTNRVSGLIASAYADRFGINVCHWRVIAVLAEQPGMSATQVAERTAHDKVSITRAVQFLTRNGFVRRRASQTDGRVSHLMLTAKGDRVCAEITPKALACEKALLAALSRDERRQLNAILEKLATRAGEIERCRCTGS